MEHIAQIIRELSKDRQFTEALISEKLKDAWPQVAEGELVRYTQVIDYKNYTLFLETSSSTWAQQMVYYKQMIIEKLRTIFPQIIIKDIKTRATGKIQPVEKSVVKKKVELTPEEEAQIIDLTAEIQDEQSRQLLSQIMRKEKIWKKSDDRQTCPLCGKRYDGTKAMCMACHSQDLHLDDQKVMDFLADVPWTRFSDFTKEHPEVSEQHYHKVKEKLMERTRDKLQSLYYEDYNTPKESLILALKSQILKYVLLKTGLTPDKINDKIILGQIGQKLFKVAYGENPNRK